MLHDCGKITTPVHVVDKATKLSGIFDRMALVEARFDLAARDAQIACSGGGRRRAKPRPPLQRAIVPKLAALDADRAFLREANRGSERMADEDVARVARDRCAAASRRADGAPQPLLTDDEVANLTIRYGTLNAAERAIINGHVATTIRMLESLPWPRQLARVPEYAGGHHERVDGKGYPRGLTREQMSLPARMIAIADVFEALTAGDRPYKRAKTVAESLAILGQMKRSGHVDPDLFDVFLREGVWLEYARKFLDPGADRRSGSGARSREPGGIGSGTDVRPALLLALHDLDHPRADVTDFIDHVAAREVLCTHRIFAGKDLHAGSGCLTYGVGDRRVELEHADAGAKSHDFDVDVRGAELRLDVMRVVQRQIPFHRFAVAYLNDDLAARCTLLRLRSGNRGEENDRHRSDKPAGQFPSAHCISFRLPARKHAAPPAAARGWKPAFYPRYRRSGSAGAALAWFERWRARLPQSEPAAVDGCGSTQAALR